ncbi:MAG: tetratricopeptide repeat protein [Deltaproteobacteria bacterium]|nr:tetratricopeptide repeat protein [Deltaproteobacteria bacterium]
MQIRNTHTVYSLFAIFSLFFLFITVSQSFAGSGFQGARNPFPILNPDRQFNYAQDLFSAKDYSTAVNEYKRFIYFFPKDERVELAMFQVGMSYFFGSHFNAAVNSFKKLTDRYLETEYSIKSYFMISEAYVKLKAFNFALINLNNLITITQDEDIRDEAFYRIGWIHIETANWDKARHYLKKISTKNRHKLRLERLADELDQEALIPQKDPNLAGFLSIIPGGGYLYCERYQDALIAFLLNGGLILAAYESFDEGHDALGGLLTFVGFGFYAGNIYGAVTSAHKFNRKETGQFIYKLKKNTRVDLSADLENKGVCLSFRFSF